MRRLALPAAIGLLLAVAAACTEPATGAPIPQTATTTTTPGSTTTTTSRLLPPRPSDIDLTGQDPCKALTEAQEKQLQYDLGWQRPPLRGVDPASGQANCSYDSGDREAGSLIAFVTNDGAEVWLTEHLSDLPPTKTTVSGFPALQITVAPNAPFPDKCNIAVDVHDGQYLDVFSSKSAGGAVTGSTPYCDEAKKVAAMVLGNLQGR